jgi:hypothetical protein
MARLVSALDAPVILSVFGFFDTGNFFFCFLFFSCAQFILYWLCSSKVFTIDDLAVTFFCLQRFMPISESLPGF